MKKVNVMKLKELWRNHKKEIIFIGAGVVVGTAVFVIAKKWPVLMASEPSIPVVNCEEIAVKIPEGIGLDMSANAIEFVNPANGELIKAFTGSINSVTPADLGKVGEELIKIEGINPDTEFSLLAVTLEFLKDLTA